MAKTLVGRINVFRDDSFPDGQQIKAQVIEYPEPDGATISTHGWRNVFDQLGAYYHLKEEVDSIE